MGRKSLGILALCVGCLLVGLDRASCAPPDFLSDPELDSLIENWLSKQTVPAYKGLTVDQIKSRLRQIATEDTTKAPTRVTVGLEKVNTDLTGPDIARAVYENLRGNAGYVPRPESRGPYRGEIPQSMWEAYYLNMGRHFFIRDIADDVLFEVDPGKLSGPQLEEIREADKLAKEIAERSRAPAGETEKKPDPTGGGDGDRTPVTPKVPYETKVEYTERAPNDPQAWRSRAKHEDYLGDTTSSFQSYRRAVANGATDPETLTAYARTAQVLGNHALAVEAALQALEQDPENRLAKAIYMFSRQKVPETDLPKRLRTMRDRALEDGSSGPRGPEAGPDGPRFVNDVETGFPFPESDAAVIRSEEFTRRAAQALKMKAYRSAISLASKAVALDPRNAKAYYYRATAYMKLGEYEKAVADANKVLALEPGNIPALLTRAWALNYLKRYAEAEKDAAQILALTKGDARAFYLRAFAKAGLGDLAGTRAALKRAAELNPAYRALYKKSLDAPDAADAMLLFDEDFLSGLRAEDAAQAPTAPPTPRHRMWWAYLAGMALLLVGLLHVFSGRTRELTTSSFRKLLSRREDPEPASADFWARYELVRELGMGGMGVVYEAKDLGLDRRVAVKKMRDEIRKNEKERERFLTEARLVAKLQHPGIVQIHSIVEDGDDAYLVFEFIDGKDLSKLVGELGKLPFDLAVKITKDACAAVDYAHAQGVIHRDLKPSNIMIRKDGAVKVMDFGIARQARDAASKMSMTNTVVGTPAYMAPEQEQGVVRKESDVFALGVCFYEMIAGRLPFEGSGSAMLLAKMKGSFAPISSINGGGLPAGLDGVLAKGLAPDAGERFSGPKEFAAALTSLSASTAS